MASNGSNRSGLLTAGGVLSIVAGALEVIGAMIIGVLTIGIRILVRLAVIPEHASDWFEHVMPCIPVIPMWLIIVGVPLFALGTVAIVGGVSALSEKEELWPVIGRGYLCPSLKHSRDTGDYFCLRVKEGIRSEGIDAEVAEWQTRYVQGVVSLRT